MRTVVIVSTDFQGIHCWPGAPEAVYFLRSLHRHVFKLRIGVVEHHDYTQDERETEFIMLKAFVTAFIPRLGTKNKGSGAIDIGTTSCELIGSKVFDYLKNKGYDVAFIEVFEDGENGVFLTP